MLEAHFELLRLVNAKSVRAWGLAGGGGGAGKAAGGGVSDSDADVGFQGRGFLSGDGSAGGDAAAGGGGTGTGGGGGGDGGGDVAGGAAVDGGRARRPNGITARVRDAAMEEYLFVQKARTISMPAEDTTGAAWTERVRVAERARRARGDARAATGVSPPRRVPL